MRLVRKLNLEKLRFFLGRNDVHHRYIRNGQSVGQLLFFALGILQPIRRLEGGTHFGVLPESDTKQEFLERRLWRNLKEPSRLNGGLKIRRMQKILGPRKNLLVPIPHIRLIGWSGIEKNLPLAKRTA